MELAPGETKKVQFTLDRRTFAYWNIQIHDWHVESGEYELQIGRNAQDIVLSHSVSVESEVNIPKVFDLNSTMGEILADPKGKAVHEQAMAAMTGTEEAQAMGDGEAISNEMIAAMMEGMPLRQLLSFVPGVTKEALNQLILGLDA